MYGNFCVRRFNIVRFWSAWGGCKKVGAKNMFILRLLRYLLSYHFLCCCCLLWGSDILWHLTIQSWRAGQAGVAGNARCGTSSLSRQLLKTASVVAWKCCPKEIAPHREVHGFPKGKYGPDLWQASLTNVLPPFRRQFFLPAPIVFPQCGFCLAGTPPHPHPPNPDRLISILMPFIFYDSFYSISIMIAAL